MPATDAVDAKHSTSEVPSSSWKKISHTNSESSDAKSDEKKTYTRISLTNNGLNIPYFIREVDRWFESGSIGGGNYIYVEGYHEISELNLASRSVRTTNGLEIVLENEPSFQQFMKIVGNKWADKGLPEDIDDYPDYIPGYYKSLADFAAGKRVRIGFSDID